MPDLAAIFVYLEEQPLLWLFVTLSAYLLAEQTYRTARNFALLNPVLISAVLIAGILWLSRTSYADYFAGAQFIHVMLGPAIIALAVPVARYKGALWRARYAVLAAVVCGGLAAALSAVVLAKGFGLSDALVASLAPKSVTAPIAMGIAEQLGGITSIAAVLAVVTGITGAVIVTPLLTRLGFTDWRARLCGGRDLSWYWHSTCLSGACHRWHICHYRHGPERGVFVCCSACVAVGSALGVGVSSFYLRRGCLARTASTMGCLRITSQNWARFGRPVRIWSLFGSHLVSIYR